MAGSGPDRAAETPGERRRRLDRVFGEPLPATTADERSGEAGAAADPAERDRHLREDRPPHHDRA